MNFFKIVFIFLISFFPSFSIAQNTQNIRGKVIDEVTKLPLPGASVIVVGTNPIVGATTDEDGKFKIENQMPGRYNLKISYMGYQERYYSNLQLFLGKELVITAELEEKIIKMKEVTITATIDKTRPLNDLATVSARAFSVEETQRYAGSLGDPSRMAQNFAGVMSTNDARNDIIIRGNSPMGLLWRMEGINIPNPNHFGASGTTGGPITMLNNNLLSNSDFFTGAFPAEYGNALSGVFDLKMRSGNNENYEFVGQVGINGFELGAEGPFSKKKSSSFLMNYRYSTLSAFDALGLKTIIGGSVPEYQDINFKLDFPTKKIGKWTLFGIGGTSFVKVWDSEKKSGQTSFGVAGTDAVFGSDMGVVGLSNTFYFNKKSVLKSYASISGTRVLSELDSIKGVDKVKSQFYRSANAESNLSFSTQLLHKFSSQDILIAGIIIDFYHVNFIDSAYFSNVNKYYKLTDTKGNTGLDQAYFQWKHRFNEQFLIITGLHFQYFALNSSKAIEPRIGMEWKLRKEKTLSFGYGLHSQTQPKIIYFVRTKISNDSIVETNKNLDFTKSNQFVIGYQQLMRKNFRFKTEIYFQSLTNVPVSIGQPNYSVLNEGAYFHITEIDSLENKGSGTNYGLEFTFEKFFYKNYYFLTTISLFQSLYRGYNKLEHPTVFDNKYVINALVGYEIPIKAIHKINIDLRSVYAGGNPKTPIDPVATVVKNSPVYFYDKAYSEKLPDYFRIDFKVSFRMNLGKTDQELTFDIQNITNHRNVFQQVWDPLNNEWKTDYQQGFFPIVLYRIYF